MADEKKNVTAKEKAMERMKLIIQGEQESYGIPPNELRLVIIGKSGNGKSSAANTIIGKDIFETGATATSITKETDTYRASRFGKKILVVDTPGLFDPEKNTKETEDEISRCMFMTLPGFHAFLLVVRIGRFTTEEMDTVKDFEKLFGEKLYDFMIIVFTRMDDLVRENKKLEDFVHCDIPKDLKQIIERCNNRYVGLNNIDSPENKERATKYLIEMIKTMIDSKNPNHYTNEAFEKAEKDLREKIQAEKERMEAAKKAEFEEMFAKKENKMREEHAIKVNEMKGAWKEERQLLEENAKKRHDKEKEYMEARFANELDKRMAKEAEIRKKLLEDLERENEKKQKEMKGIKDEVIKKQKMDEDKINELRKDIARKEKEEKKMYDKLKADHERERLSFQAKMLDNEREWREKEREKEMEMHAMHKQQLEEERNRMEDNHKRLIAEMSRPIVMQGERKRGPLSILKNLFESIFCVINRI